MTHLEEIAKKISILNNKCNKCIVEEPKPKVVTETIPAFTDSTITWTMGTTLSYKTTLI